ncbi:hypothetical protein M1L65_05430 [Slackia exigua]|uniref:hypothetical protein n=1 Tax=Slackia exigua TaxID=84109 RepID=UPI003B9EF646
MNLIAGGKDLQRYGSARFLPRLASGASSAAEGVADAQSPEGTYDGRTADEWIGIGDAAIQQVSDGASAMSKRLSAASSDAAAGAAL